MTDRLPASNDNLPRGDLLPTAGLVAEPPAAERASVSEGLGSLLPPITPGVVLRAVGRRWAQAVIVGGVIAAVAAFAAWTLRPDKYVAFALLRVTSQVRVLDQGQQADFTGEYARTQLALIRSRPVLRAALRNEKVRQLPVVFNKPDPIDWLEKELRAEKIEGTEIIRVSLTARGNGSDLAAVVNAVTEAYMAEVVRGEHASQQARLNDLQTAYNDAEGKLRLLRESVNNLTRDLKGGDSKILTLKQQATLDEYVTLRRELALINTRERELDVKIAAHRLKLGPPANFVGPPAPRADATPSGPLDVLVERDLEADPRVQAKDAEVTRLQDLVRQYDEVAAGGRSGLREEAQRRLEQAREAASAVRDERRAAIAARYATVSRAATAASLRELESERLLLGKQREAMAADVADRKKELDRLGLSSVDLELRRAEIDRSEQFVKAIWEQKERIEVELKGSSQLRVTQAAPAEEATILSKYGRHQEAAGAGLAGLCLGCLAVAAWDLRKGQIHCPKGFTRGLRARVLGSLPALPGSLAKPIGLPGGAPGGESTRGSVEAADGIRTAILHEFDGRGAALMVVSAGAGEGKSTVAAQLAASLARARYRTLLVDGDLRSPVLHQAFGAAQSPGLCELLGHGGAIEDAIRPTESDCLHLLPAGGLTAEAVAGLARPAALRQLFERLRAGYDFLVIDSSPLLLATDALLIARQADGLILSVRPGVSLAADVQDGCARLGEFNLPVTGVVINGVVAKRYGRYGKNSLGPTADAGLPIADEVAS